MNTKIIISILIVIAILSFGIGASTNLESVKKFVSDPVEDTFEPLNLMNKSEIEALIDIKTQNELYNKRAFLINFIWSSDTISDKLPDSIEENFQHPIFSEINNLKQINKLEIISEYNVNSISYHFIPEKSNNKLVIYHQGHDGDFINGVETIEYLLNKEYSVLAFSMPLTGKNNQPIINHPSFGKIKLMSHDHFALLETTNFEPIKLFFEPITRGLNYLDSNFDYDSYSMIGISGGGWTTTIYSAIDERISKSFSVAGSYPIYLRSEPKNLGDYEQTRFDLYSKVNYLELYVLGASQRLHLQIFNEYDPCCFSGNGATTFEQIVQTKINNIGSGSFETHVDEFQSEHKISKNSLELIYKKLI
ncbi:MAG: hypothetical protein CMH75_05535 [Nitrospina sp.]|nr:hypothetical protein [Nitrospina sp.]|tara:strand:- start:118 stop:1206 length:1089 start_codon:yes stop_codon:yes gene_type:complete